MFPDNRRNKMASYKKQLTDLLTRQEILSNEYSSLVDERNHVTHSLQQEQSQIKNIEKQEEEISKSISELQHRLKSLNEHRFVQICMCLSKELILNHGNIFV